MASPFPHHSGNYNIQAGEIGGQPLDEGMVDLSSEDGRLGETQTGTQGGVIEGIEVGEREWVVGEE